MMTGRFSYLARVSASAGLALALAAPMLAGDWPEWRGPTRDSTSAEKGLPEKWSPQGENLGWRVPIGGRSSPVVFDGRVYLFTTTGQGETLQEVLIALDAETGKKLWERPHNVFLSDVPPHRAAWASPTVDPETGNVYVYGVCAYLAAYSKDGKLLWERSLTEELGAVTTHGGRTVSPTIDEGLLIISNLTSNWGDQARGLYRYFGFDKKTGELVWSASPGSSPFDTIWAPPTIAVIDGLKLYIAGSGDGAVHAMKPRTGELVWSYPMSKRGVNAGVAVSGSTVLVSHSEENLNTSQMGLLAAIDGTRRGEIKDAKWALTGWMGGFSSPILDGDRLYQIDVSGNLSGFDVQTGRRLWNKHLDTVQKGTPALADGKLYVGTENGKFYILRPHNDKVEVLDEDQLGPEDNPEMIYGSPAISNGRIFLTTTSATYAIGTKTTKSPTRWPSLDDGKAAADAKVAHVQVVPADALLTAGKPATFRARLFDDKGRFIKEAPATWSLAGLKGEIGADGKFTPAAGLSQGGMVKAKAGEVEGVSRVRAFAPLPWSIDFNDMTPPRPPSHWISATGKTEVREIEGEKVLVKLSTNPFLKRTRVYLGPPDWSNYTIEVDFMADQVRRQMGDAGVISQRYQLTLFGNKQELAIMPWQPETNRSVTKKFKWAPKTWYRMKLRVENTADGKTIARGKVWPRGEAEPAEWTIEKTDAAIPNRNGSPAIYADAPGSTAVGMQGADVFFDNLKVTANGS